MIQGAGIVGVDVGSTKTCAVVATVHPGRKPADPLEILGLGVTDRRKPRPAERSRPPT